MEFLVSARRISKYLNSDEMNAELVHIDSDAPMAVSVSNANFTWGAKKKDEESKEGEEGSEKKETSPALAIN